VGFDTPEAGLLAGEVLLYLRLPHPQHAPELPGRQLGADLLQTEAKLPQRHKAVEPGQLGNVVEPVPGMRVDLGWRQQAVQAKDLKPFFRTDRCFTVG
jgi:hypothetical protein